MRCDVTGGDFRAVIDVLRAGRFPVRDSVTRAVPLAVAAEAPSAWDADPGAVTRIHVDLD